LRAAVWKVTGNRNRALPLHQEAQHLNSPPDGLLMVTGGNPIRVGGVSRL
jgi:hypothetical protein